jgi:hypothetical protein
MHVLQLKTKLHFNFVGKFIVLHAYYEEMIYIT